MSLRRTLLVTALLPLLSPALAILPQLEPDRTVLCATTATPDSPCRAPDLPASQRTLLQRAGEGKVLPYREALWTATEREYKLVGRTGRLYVTLTRSGTGPWQVRQVGQQPAPRVLVPGGLLRGNAPVTVRVSGFTPGAQVQARVAPPNVGAGQPLASGVVGVDGTAVLTFVMPGVWPGAERLITESPLVVVVGTTDGCASAVSGHLAYRPGLAARDLTARHEGELGFRHLGGQQVRVAPGQIDLLEVGTHDAVTVVQARRFQRAPGGPAEDAAYVRNLLALHPDVLRPFAGGDPVVEGAVDTPGGAAWRVLVRSADGDRPVYVLFHGPGVWVLQGNPAHAALLDAVVRTVAFPDR